MSLFPTSWSTSTLLIVLLFIALLLSLPILRLLYLRQRLSRQITHSSRSLTTSIASPSSNQQLLANPLLDFPRDLIVHPSDYRIIFDTASRSVPKASLPTFTQPTANEDHDGATQANPAKELIVTYLQHNMQLFARTPQALAIRALTPAEDKHTFDAAYLSKCPFNVGDVVCGLYRVLKRADGVVNMGMRQGKVEGRLVVKIEEEDVISGGVKGQVRFTTETYMWIRKGEGTMPLEGGLGRWGHEITSWSLIWKGTEYLKGLRREEDKRR